MIDHLLSTIENFSGLCCVGIKTVALQEPSSLGRPRKCSGRLNVLQQHLTLHMLGSLTSRVLAWWAS